VPDAIKGDFNGFVTDPDSLHLRAMKRSNDGVLTVISDVPVTPELLQPATSLLGSVTVFPPGRDGDLQIPPPATASPLARRIVDAGAVPPPSSRFDWAIQFYTIFATVDWETGKSQTGAIGVVTRPSMLYTALFSTLGDKVEIWRNILLGIAIFFGLIELVALYIGVRLSRGMTLSVAELYRATEHVEQGDLMHRIQVRGNDQMSKLEQSFNSMTQSLAKLIAEQKEKQRLESELAIGYQVQDSLFPHNFTGLASLEVYGVCRPARSVSGDYYDFIPLGADGLVLAVGDISGKGISAALLMATVHAFVRAYTLEPDVKLTSPRDPRMYYRGDGATPSQLAPAMLMTTLNYQLFRSTPPEKYATMFLGCYDARSRELKYSNAGHLPPILLKADGSVRRLDTSGTVVGLFDGATYDESTIAMQPDDLLVAFSDGVTEPENESGEFGEQRLIELVQEHRHQPLSQIGDMVTRAVTDWIGSAEQPDDVTVVLARAR
jgi:sigma-B regulation protein RsbU (phosphoserine phosphatase)